MKFLLAASDSHVVQNLGSRLLEAGLNFEIREELAAARGARAEYSELWVTEGTEFEFAQLLSTCILAPPKAVA